MIAASWKSLLGRKVRLLMSAFAVVLGVAFVAGSLIFTDMLGSAFNGIMNGTVADVNVGPKGQGDGVTSSMMVRRELPASSVAALRSVPGVKSAHGVTTVMDAYLIGKDGKAIATMGAPNIGTNWIDAPAFGGQPGLVLKSGRSPTADNEVVIDPASLDKSGYRLGDTIKIATSGSQPIVKATIVGTALWGARNSTGGATYAMFSDAFTQKLFSQGRDTWGGVWVVAADGVNPDDLAARVAPSLPEGFEAVTGKKVADQAEKGIAMAMGFISTFLLVFAGIALIVGSFLIANTFSILVAQRSRELALLRAMGASRMQVRTSVVFEAVVVGLIGSTLGLLAGFGLAKLIAIAFSGMGLQVGDVGMSLAPRTIVAAYAVGVVVTVLSALLPAQRAAKVAPVAAMSGDAMTGTAGLGKRAVVGLTLAGLGVAALLIGLFTDVPQTMWWIGGGALFTLLGVAGASPVLGRPVIWLMGRLYTVFGPVGRLAEVNAVRNPRRTAATASALMIGLTLVTMMATLGASMKASTDVAVRKSLRSDYVVQNVSMSPFSAAVGDQMARVPGVKAVHRMRFQPAQVDGRMEYVGAMAASSFDKIIAQRLESGSLSAFTGNAVLLNQDYARNNGLAVGRQVSTVINGTTLPLTVAGTFSVDKGTGMGDILVTLDAVAKTGAPAVDMMLAIEQAPGANAAAVKSGLDAVVTELPMVTVTDQEGYAQQQAKALDQILGLVYALLGLAIVIAILGIVNTLALSVIERTREIGLLRAIGLSRTQLRRMVRLESVAIAILGSVLGITMGLFFGFALQRAAAGEGLNVLEIPVLQVGGFLVVAAVVGVLAALWPAFRAARLNVLQAITNE